MSLLNRFYEEVSWVWTIDTHEHIYPYPMIAEIKPSIFEVLSGSYVSWLISMPGKGDYEGLAEKLRRVKASAFFRSCVEALRDLYGVDISDLSEESLRLVSEKIGAAYLDGEWQRRVLREKARIRKCILDPYWDVWIEGYDRDCFALAFRINMFLFGYNREARDHNGNSPYDLAEKLGISVEDFDDYLDFIDKVLQLAKERGYICLKSALAYDRHLYFEDVGEEEARRVFGKSESEVSSAEREKFGDFIMHYILSRAEELSLPLQVHTGLARIEGSNPLNMVNLFRKYPGVRFVLLHGGYPWTSEVVALAFSFPNVYLDLCWLPIISPSAAARLLEEAIEVTGGSKVMWGGDCWVVEGTYGALKMMRSILSNVFSRYVERKYLSLGDALEVAEMILSSNAREVFRL